MSTNRGFTLIEILIVIVIIGISVGFALLAFGDFGGSRSVQFAAEELGSTLKLAQQYALLESSTLGLRIDNKKYQILKLNNTSEWIPLPHGGVFKVRYFPKNTVFSFKSPYKPPVGYPALILNASGEITPFSLVFGTSADTDIVTLSADNNGTIHIYPKKPK